MAPSIISKKKLHFNRHSYLQSEFDSYWKDKYRDISDYIYYKGARFLEDESYPSDGKKRDTKIYNSTATIAHNTLTAGIYSSVTSPAIPWFRLTIDDPILKEVKAVKEYFDEVTRIILTDLGKSNFYTSAEFLFAELSAFGTSAVQVEADQDNIFRFTPFTIGEYYIDADANGVVDYISREFSMRARNVINKFGEENVSDEVKLMVEDDKTGEEWVKILHVQERNYDRDVTKLDAANKPYLSTYYEFTENASNDDSKRLRQSGYDTKPFAAPRWTVTGTDVYGTGPGDTALSDAKSLQSMTYDHMVAIKKQVKPPMLGDGAGGEMAVNAGAGGMTWIDGVTEGQRPPIVPLQLLNVNLQELILSIQMVEERIKSVFFSNLFFLIAQTQKGNQTATEVVAKEREKLALLGPIVERMTPEYLQIIITRCFGIEVQLDRLPEPPEEIRNRDIKIEIISQIKQAQELAVVTPILEVANAAQVLSQTWPEALLKFNAQQALDIIAAAQGVNPSIINSDEEVAEKEAELEAQRQAEQQAILAQGAIDSAKTLSETDTSGDNALTALTGGAAA